MENTKVGGKRSRVHTKRHRRLRTHKLLATLIVLVVVAALSGATELAYGNVKSQGEQLQASLTSQLQAGQHELESGKDALKQANAKHDVNLVSQAVAHFAAAKIKFTATKQLADDSKFLRYLEYAPSIGDFARSRHSSVVAIAQTGAALSDAGQDLSALDGQILKPGSSGEAGRTLLTVLAQTEKGLIKVRGDLTIAQKAAAQVNVQLLPAAQQATFVRARDSIDSALAGFVEFERLVPVITEVLGGNGTRNYLIEQVNPAELRAGGGFIGTYSLLQADHGSLSVSRSGNAYVLADPRPIPGEPGFVPLPGPYREIIPWVSWSFVDTNEFPDFASNARAAESFAQRRLGKIDGVISIDYFAVAKMLELTGPMQIPGYSLTLNGGNFVSEVMRLELASDPAHKNVLGALAGPLMSRIATLPPENWPALMAALNGLAMERHLQAYFNDANVENELDQVGWSGRLNARNSTDFMMEVESNYGGGKANYALQRHYTVSLTRNGGVLHHVVTVNYTNEMPPTAADIVGYRAVVRLYAAFNASSINSSLRPVRYQSPDPPASTRFAEGWLPNIHCCGGQAQAVFEYDTLWSNRDRGVHQIFWQKQPGTASDRLDVIWSDGNGHTYTIGGDLGQDRVINLTPTGVTLAAGQAAAATLPSLSLG
jgi:hypothetical protein